MKTNNVLISHIDYDFVHNFARQILPEQYGMRITYRHAIPIRTSNAQYSQKYEPGANHGGCYLSHCMNTIVARGRRTNDTHRS